MALTRGIISWKSTGRVQQTLARSLELTGVGLHSGKSSNVRISPEHAGKGRTFDFNSKWSIPASVDFALRPSPLCTTLSKDGFSIRTVEHLLSALEATGVDNCRIRIDSADSDDSEVEVPILDGSALKWVDLIREVGVRVAVDENGCCYERLAPHLHEPFHVRNDDSFVAAFPSPELHITYGIQFPQVERMRNAGLIKGGSLENAIVCSATEGWINGPLRFPDEPCRHKVLDFIGDFSLHAQSGNQGLPVAQIVAYKGGHALHTDFVRGLAESFIPD